jgi:hypothetical protein
VTTTSNRNLSQRSHKGRRKAKVRDAQDAKGKGKDDGKALPENAAPSGSTSRLLGAFGDAEAEEQVGLLQDEARQDTLDEGQSAEQSRYSFGEERDVWGA